MRPLTQLLVVACVLGMSQAAREKYTYQSGLTVTITKRVPQQNCTIWSQNGDTLRVHYTGALEDGTVFDSSIPKGVPWTFVLGWGQAIRGYDLGLGGMCVGEKRQLIIPASLAYGDWGVPSAGIPGGATLYFDDELMELIRPPAN